MPNRNHTQLAAVVGLVFAAFATSAVLDGQPPENPGGGGGYCEHDQCIGQVKCQHVSFSWNNCNMVGSLCESTAC